MREEAWERLVAEQPWDLVVVGGGITGAGVFREAVRLGLRVALVEGRDFAWGTSSRSGKMVHGGLRYLRQGQVRLTWTSAREREHLLRVAPGLADPLDFLLPLYRRSDRLLIGIGLNLYDLFVRHRYHAWVPAEDFLWQVPAARRDGLRGAFRYREGWTDDARLVLRLIQEASAEGGLALNYVEVVQLLRGNDGRVAGVAVRDRTSGQTAEITARAVVNATGAWADALRRRLRRRPRLRPLRGSHLLFPAWRFPLPLGVAFFHPVDRRPLYALPWMGATLVGTTDVDHPLKPDEEPRPTAWEVAYLLEALRHVFPFLDLTEQDIVAAFAGVRPVVSHGKAHPSREPREHEVWYEDGLLTVTGGKLTTFRALAHDALRHLRRELGLRVPFRRVRLLDAAPPRPEGFPSALWRWLAGRYGREAARMVSEIPAELWQPIAETPFLQGEVLWALRHEGVVHLDDLLLRRVRVGLVLRDGGLDAIPALHDWCREVLGWDEARWRRETQRYRELLQAAYRPPREAAP